MSNEEVLFWANTRTQYGLDGHIDGDTHDPCKKSGVKKLSILFSLPYWKTSPLVQAHPRTQLKNVKPQALYVLSKGEQKVVVDRLEHLKVPSGYSAALKKHILRKKLENIGDPDMKSHDYHVLIQQIMPYCIRGLMDSDVSMTIVRVSHIFRSLCVKVWDLANYPRLVKDVAETLCLLEMHFPASFFDLTIHLLVHLVEEINIAGPMATRWMYPVERYLGVLKKYVRSKARPEASMAEGYIMDEALGYVTEYIHNFAAVTTRVWDADEEDVDSGEVLEGKGLKRTLLVKEGDAPHNYILHNIACLEQSLKYHF